MALYTIGDLHLSLGSNKPMDIFGDRWQNYVEKIRLGFSGRYDGAVRRPELGHEPGGVTP